MTGRGSTILFLVAVVGVVTDMAVAFVGVGVYFIGGSGDDGGSCGEEEGLFAVAAVVVILTAGAIL